MQENEYPISLGLKVVANGQSSVQVNLGGRGQIYLIKFNSPALAEEFLRKVNNDRGEQEGGERVGSGLE